jgi:hypothetical protein
MVGQQFDVSPNTLRRLIVEADIGDGQRTDVPTATLEELSALKAENRRLVETKEILHRASIFFAGELDPRTPLIKAFIDALVGEGFAVEAVCAVLTSEGCQAAARTYTALRVYAAAPRPWPTSRNCQPRSAASSTA